MTVKQAPALAAGLVAGLMLIPAMAQSCAGAGVITRIAGRPQDVVIMRSEGGGPKAPSFEESLMTRVTPARLDSPPT